jgi:hypothetical protein
LLNEKPLPTEADSDIGVHMSASMGAKLYSYDREFEGQAGQVTVNGSDFLDSYLVFESVVKSKQEGRQGSNPIGPKHPRHRSGQGGLGLAIKWCKPS